MGADESDDGVEGVKRGWLVMFGSETEPHHWGFETRQPTSNQIL